ncbi:hypothetical protein ASE21_11820 [Flavobacterium sp. Root901]|uniref:hypothetical protein n=1 Tax=Flavobacterium sp. Root901 TaxID=1736605 RepID=UPI00070AD698|nr:hypothetical protein [Flavobacterium sp. Root901]KRD10387.1 hypothetical protein ASE21_11820 [Flavobacterium sp. Root901]
MAQYQKHLPMNTTSVTAANSNNNISDAVQLKDNRTTPVAQLGKKHHDPEKKKYLAKGVGKKQNDISAAALAIKKASPVPISNKEAKRMAK